MQRFLVHCVELKTDVDGAYRAMEYLDDVMKLKANVDWQPDMRDREKGVIRFWFRNKRKALLFKLGWPG